MSKSKVISVRVDENFYEKLEGLKGDKRLTDFVKEYLERMIDKDNKKMTKEVDTFKDVLKEMERLTQLMQSQQHDSKVVKQKTGAAGQDLNQKTIEYLKEILFLEKITNYIIHNFVVRQLSASGKETFSRDIESYKKKVLSEIK
ncbi:MAG: hypothetical protein HY279_02660 [Nitrospinae bacterium]|nr:hypothetical protein [Nitrospinota bacterium]